MMAYYTFFFFWEEKETHVARCKNGETRSVRNKEGGHRQKKKIIAVRLFGTTERRDHAGGR